MTSSTMEEKGSGLCSTLYRGAALFEELREHDLGAGDTPTGRSGAAERMREFASRITASDFDECPEEALYQIAIWALIEEPGYFDEERDIARLLGVAARNGHEASMLVLAKATNERIWWAEDELRQIARDGNAPKLAEKWLGDLAARGYEDAKVEYAETLWRSGRRDEAIACLDSADHELPERAIRKGLYLLASDPPRGMKLIDEGEGLAALNGNQLARLSEALRGLRM